MQTKIKVMTIFGTRPEAIKMAPVIRELKKFPDKIESIVTVTAQHREMLDQVLTIFEIIPDYDLNIMKDQQTLIDITTTGLKGLDGIMKQAKPDIVLVHGDTTTTFIASLVAFYHQIPVGHVEAGVLKLVGTDTETIFSEASHLLANKVDYEKMAKITQPYGDGQASKRIVAALLAYFSEEPSNS